MKSTLIKTDRRFGMSVFVNGKWVALSKDEELDVLILLSKER